MSADELLDQTAREIVAECGALADLLIEKNRKYGNSALRPLRLFSRADAVEQLRVRIDDKLSRIRSAQADDAEDAELDLLGYLVLLRIARRKARQWGDIDDMLDPREAATPPQDVQRREQVATGLSAMMDRMLASASRVGVHNGPNGDGRAPMPEVYGGHVVCSGCGLKCSIGSEQEQSVNLTGRCTLCRAEKEREAYTIPPPQDGDDDPAVVHVVPDRSSRSTLPDACLGALCGRRPAV